MRMEEIAALAEQYGDWDDFGRWTFQNDDKLLAFVDAVNMSQECVDETAKSKHEPLEQCSYPKCQATNGCVGVCSKGQPDLARVGEVGIWGDKREWVGLTDEERDYIWEKNRTKLGGWDHGGDEVMYDGHFGDAVIAIEAKLKEKNT